MKLRISLHASNFPTGQATISLTKTTLLRVTAHLEPEAVTAVSRLQFRTSHSGKPEDGDEMLIPTLDTCQKPLHRRNRVRPTQLRAFSRCCHLPAHRQALGELWVCRNTCSRFDSRRWYADIHVVRGSDHASGRCWRVSMQTWDTAGKTEWWSVCRWGTRVYSTAQASWQTHL